jgi:thiosulfate reductase cytochrome b subunit
LAQPAHEGVGEERDVLPPVPKGREVGISLFLIPFQMATGLLYYTYSSWPAMGLEALRLGLLAGLHTAGAFALLVFLVVHVYMTTTGHSITAHIRAMCTGWEEVPAGERAGD